MANGDGDSARWAPPEWMVPHLDALGLTERTIELMSGPRANVFVNAPLGLEQMGAESRVELLTRMHTPGLLPPLLSPAGPDTNG